MFNDAVHVNYIYKAGKPKPAGYRKAMAVLGTDTSNTIFVGDQIFTDVCGAKSGQESGQILVKADPSQRGDSDCVKASVRSDCTAFLSSAL